MFPVIPFEFQIGKKAACEDAPPVVNQSYALVCDGMGGAGTSLVQLVNEAGEMYTRTNAYIGSRIVSNSANEYLDSCLDEIKSAVLNCDDSKLRSIVNGLKGKIVSDLNAALVKYNIEVSRSITIRTFPTTLAIAVYFQQVDTNYVLTIWTGDSRVYALTGKGLFLLTQDDTPDPDAMTTDSKLINRISAGRPFTINYALYTFNEPIFTFACSDGCFDGFLSPLNFEWLLIRSILDINTESEENIGKVMSQGIAKSMYSRVIDDTTLAGAFIGGSSLEKMKKDLEKRLLAFEPDALTITDHIDKRNGINSKRSDIKRIIALNSGRIEDTIYKHVFSALKTKDGDDVTLSILKSLPSYASYLEAKKDIETTIKSRYDKRVEELQDDIAKTRALCTEMIISDHMKWKRVLDEREQSFIILGQFPFIGREIRKPNHLYVSPERTLQMLYTYIGLLEHPDYQLLVSDSIPSELEVAVRQLEKMTILLRKREKQVIEAWSQAYFSTRCHREEREKYYKNRDYETKIDDILADPQKYEFLTSLTCAKISNYTSKLNEIANIQRSRENDIRDQITELIDSFWRKNKTAIIESFMNLNIDAAVSGFTSDEAVMLNTQIANYTKLNAINAQIKEETSFIEPIWDRYKRNFQYYNYAKLRGVSDDN